MNILHIDSSILGDHSASRKFSRDVVAKLTTLNPGADLTYYDLAANPISYLTGGMLAAAGKPDTDRTADEQRDLNESDHVMRDFMQADTIVIGVPMYNFGIPAQLKSWIDRVAVAGKTFRYTADGPIGLAGGKRVIIVSSRGGFYGPNTAIAAMDHQEAHLKTVLGFLGITDIQVVQVEGLARGPENVAAAHAQALEQINALV